MTSTAEGWDLYAPWDLEALSDILEELVDLFDRYVSFPSLACRDAVVLWGVHAHALPAFESTPRLALLSPEKGSGKTRTLEVLDLIVPRPMHAVNCTAAALFRAVAAKKPTLLFDEADTYFGPRARKEHEELRGLINAGHRRGAVAYRVVGDGSKMEVREFPAFAAVALAGIGDLPDTILDRSVIVKMKRRGPHERLEPFRHRDVAPRAEKLRERLSQWANQNIEVLAAARPVMPDGITDRPADVWEPLIAIADAAGGNWPERARKAAVEINTGRIKADPSLGVQLLEDIRTVFTTEKMSSEDLVNKLCDLEEAPWGDLRGRRLDVRELAKRLRRFDVRPKNIRLGEDRKQVLRGYEKADFVDVWERYLSPEPLETATSATSPTEHVSQSSDVAANGAVALQDVLELLR